MIIYIQFGSIVFAVYTAVAFTWKKSMFFTQTFEQRRKYL